MWAAAHACSMCSIMTIVISLEAQPYVQNILDAIDNAVLYMTL